MRRQIKSVFFVLVLFFSAIVSAQGVFERGNAAYRKGDYQAAVDAYESILRSKKESPELYFNLGNAYYKMHRVAPAIYHYEKALLLHPDDRDIRENLEFARKLAIDDIRAVPKVGFAKMTSDLAGWFHYDSWAWIAVGGAFVFLLLFIGYYFSSASLRKRLFFVGMFASLFVIGVACASAAFGRSVYRHDRPAIVFQEVAEVKAEPKADAQDAFVLHEGTKVHVLEELEGWKKIELPDESTGWIDSGAIREIK